MAVLFEQMNEFRGVEEVTAGGRGASIVSSAAQSRHTSWASLGKYLALISGKKFYTTVSHIESSMRHPLHGSGRSHLQQHG